MAIPLLTRDANRLRALARPRGQLRFARWAVFLGGWVLFAVHAVATPSPVCSDASPCQPSAIGTVIISLLFAAGITGPVHAATAFWFAAAFAVTFIAGDRLINPDPPSPVWTYLVDLGFVALCLAMARLRPLRRSAETDAWLAAVTRWRVPASGRGTGPDGTGGDGAGRGRRGRVWRVGGLAFFVMALCAAGWSGYAQSRADDQQRAAQRVTGVVVAHPDEFTIRVRIPGLNDANIAVVDATNHPVGQRLDLYVDGRGLRQPVSEPYDATPWLALTVMAGGVGIACWRRGRDKELPRRELLETEQPVSQVYVRHGYGVAAVYAWDARAGEPPIAVLNLALPDDIRAGAEDGLVRTEDVHTTETGPSYPSDDDEEDEADDDGPLVPTRPGRLYGVPAPGTWCALEVDGEVFIARRPVPSAVHAPPFTPPSVEPEPTGDLPHPQSLPLRPEEVTAIAPADLDPNPHQVHTYRPSRLVALYVALGVPLLLFQPASLVHLSFGTWLLIAAVVAAISFGLAARVFLRGRIVWNGAGIAVVGGWSGSRRVPWRDVNLIEHDGDLVTIHIGDRGFAVTAGSLAGLRNGRRSAEELAYALRYARERAIALGEQPEVDLPPLSMAARTSAYGLVALYLADVPLLAWALSAFSAL